MWEDVLLLKKLWNRKAEFWQDQIPIYTQCPARCTIKRKLGIEITSDSGSKSLHVFLQALALYGLYQLPVDFKTTVLRYNYVPYFLSDLSI